jgi:hypothetical protein
MTKAAFFAAVLFLVAGAAGAETYPQLPPRAPLPNAVTCANRVLASEASWGEQRPDNADENRRTGSYTFNGVINGVQGSHTYPMTKYRTPFGIDYANGWQRACVDGNFTWLGSDYISSNAERRTWGCIRAWYSGLWYDEGSDFYEAQVRYILAQRFWEQPGFFH